MDDDCQRQVQLREWDPVAGAAWGSSKDMKLGTASNARRKGSNRTRFAEQDEALVAAVPESRSQQQLRGVDQGRGAPCRLQAASCQA